MNDQTAKRRQSFGNSLHCAGIVALHALVVGFVIWWWGIHWVPQYLKFHSDKGYLNPNLQTMVAPWMSILALSVAAKLAILIGILLVDYLVLSFLVSSRFWGWLTDFWTTVLLGAPLWFVVVTGTKMLDSYWSLHERIETQRHRTVQQRGQDFQNLVGTWKLLAREKDGFRKHMQPSTIELVIENEEYRWRTEKGECLGSWSVYSSSDKNEMSFVPNEIDDKAWGGQGYYRVTPTRLGLHLVNEPGFFELSDFDTRTGGELWIFRRVTD